MTALSNYLSVFGSGWPKRGALHETNLSALNSPRPKAVRLALKRFRTEPRALYHAYTQATERINFQEADFQEHAERALSWITCPKRPLNNLGLQHALAVNW